LTVGLGKEDRLVCLCV